MLIDKKAVLKLTLIDICDAFAGLMASELMVVTPSASINSGRLLLLSVSPVNCTLEPMLLAH
jgi:hypothetical protein